MFAPSRFTVATKPVELKASDVGKNDVPTENGEPGTVLSAPLVGLTENIDTLSFPVGLEVREYGEVDSRNSLGERPHATFTKEYRVAANPTDEHPSRRAFTDLVAFFERNLRACEH